MLHTPPRVLLQPVQPLLALPRLRVARLMAPVQLPPHQLLLLASRLLPPRRARRCGYQSLGARVATWTPTHWAQCSRQTLPPRAPRLRAPHGLGRRCCRGATCPVPARTRRSAQRVGSVACLAVAPLSHPSSTDSRCAHLFRKNVVKGISKRPLQRMGTSIRFVLTKCISVLPSPNTLPLLPFLRPAARPVSAALRSAARVQLRRHRRPAQRTPPAADSLSSRCP